MNTLSSHDDLELDRMWRETFGQPLPLLGCAELVREVLRRSLEGLTAADANSAVAPALCRP